jgi:hypothetical protein
VERVDFLGHKMPFQKGATRLGPKPKSLPLAEGTVQRGGREKNASSPARLLACVPGRPSTTSRVRSCATVSISSISTTTSITTTPTLPSQHPTIIPLRHLAPSLPPLLPPPSLPPSLSPPRPTLFARSHSHRSAVAMTIVAVVERVLASPCSPTHPHSRAGRSGYASSDILAGQWLPSDAQNAGSASRGACCDCAHERGWRVIVQRSGAVRGRCACCGRRQAAISGAIDACTRRRV